MKNPALTGWGWVRRKRIRWAPAPGREPGVDYHEIERTTGAK
jgi:hypothetical protein